ncbi:unnamed protein product [Heligmosomoides polygyrus]|uniref:Transposase n=1 Tax=Heligmosomoides polygyrus TaxID=6339 RepID=A0A183G0N3_HELPZ|nr:unnamed protein product [Heligmosomoides polygyrus]
MKEKEAAMISRVRLPTVTTVDETWKRATDAIPQAARLEFGTTKPGRRKVDKQTWLWTDDVKASLGLSGGMIGLKLREKNLLYHVFLGDKTADNWQKYQKAKNATKKAVATAKAAHCGDVYRKLGMVSGICTDLLRPAVAKLRLLKNCLAPMMTAAIS